MLLTNLAFFKVPDFFPKEHLVSIIYAILTVIAGFIIGNIASNGITKAVKKHASAQQLMLLRKLVKYFIIIIFVFSALQQVGFTLSVLLSAAGVLTVAVSFASQTAFSNIISGIFLIIERPFKVGDSISINGNIGEVLTIDLLSIKIRTADNTLIRIANEQLLKTPITNLSFYNTRRFDLKVGVSYNDDLEKVFTLLKDIAAKQPLALNDPEPKIFILGFGNSSIDLQFSVWCLRTDLAEFKNELQQAVKRTFDEHGINIPYPIQTLYINNM